MRSLGVIGGCVLVVLSAAAAGYIMGEPIPSVAAALIVLLIVWAVSRGTASLQQAGQRRNDVALRRAERLFDSTGGPLATDYPGRSRTYGCIDGRDAEFLCWLPSENPPDVPRWQQAIWALNSGEDGGPAPAFGFRLSCRSPIAFQVKRWGVLPGPPFQQVKLDSAAIGDDPVDFTTATTEALTVWRERDDCRRLAERLVLECGVLQVGVTPSDITIWWSADVVWRWTVFAKILPAAVDTMARLAGAVDGRAVPGDGSRRKCGHCGEDLTRDQAFCAECGTPWWEDAP